VLLFSPAVERGREVVGVPHLGREAEVRRLMIVVGSIVVVSFVGGGVFAQFLSGVRGRTNRPTA
jgi:hypothetical protein